MTYAMVKEKEPFPGQGTQGNKVFGSNRKCHVHFLSDGVVPPWTLAFWIFSILLVFRQPACPCRRDDSEPGGLCEVPEWSSCVAN